MAKMTKKGARQVTNDLDKLATLFQSEYETLGIPRRIAMDAALRFDMLSDAIERNAGWDPHQIGEEVAGPLVDEPDEGYMNQEFSQQENRELRERQEKGELGPGTSSTEPQKPTPGVQASFKGLIAALKSGDYDEGRVSRALRLATSVVKQGKGEVPEQFKEHQFKKKDDEDDEKESKKKAHGYNLYQ